MNTSPSTSLQRQGIDWGSAMFTAVTAAATMLILVILFVILGNIGSGTSWKQGLWVGCTMSPMSSVAYSLPSMMKRTLSPT